MKYSSFIRQAKAVSCPDLQGTQDLTWQRICQTLSVDTQDTETCLTRISAYFRLKYVSIFMVPTLVALLIVFVVNGYQQTADMYAVVGSTESVYQHYYYQLGDF